MGGQGRAAGAGAGGDAPRGGEARRRRGRTRRRGAGRVADGADARADVAPSGKPPPPYLPAEDARALARADWVGAIAAPATGMLYVPSHTLPFLLYLRKSGEGYASQRAAITGPEGLPLPRPPYPSLLFCSV